MPTLYLDFENGNDNHAGSSFATLASGTDGRITTATFSSATATFPNDGSLIGQYLSIFNGTIYAVYNITAWVSATSLTIAAISGGTALTNQAVDRQYYIGGRWKNITTGATAVRTVPGDTIRIMGSPAPTSLGQSGVWTSQALQATKSITSSTNATPIAVTVTAHGYSTGDTVVITSHFTNTNANGTWEITSTGANTFTLDGSVGNGVGGATGTVRLRNNTRVMLTTAVTQNIASTGPGRAAWVGSANVTTTLSTNQKEHVNSDSIAIAAGFTTGLAAYWATGTVDLSSYQQVSFWIQQTTGTIGAAGAVDLRLCSDAAGVTAVNTISIPNLAGTGRWMPVTVDLGTNLGSSIRSIALYVNTDNGAQTFLINNIIACKASSAADSLTLTSLIGKNTTGETFWGIQSINGRRVMLDADTNATPVSTTVRGYYGTSETATPWKRETIKLGPAAGSTTALQSIQESGSDGSPITYSGGWDRTAMTTQNLETWLDGANGNGRCIASVGLNYITIQKIAATRSNTLVYASSSSDFIIDVPGMSNMSGTTTGPGIDFATGSRFAQISIQYAAANNSVIEMPGNDGALNIGKIWSSGTTAVTLGASMLSCAVNSLYNDSGLFNGGTGPALNIASGGLAYIKKIIFRDNISGVSNSGQYVYLIDCLVDDITEVSTSFNGSPAVFSQNHDQTADNHKIFMSGALISSATDQRHTASGISWKIQPISAIRTSNRPVTLSLAKVACAANSLVTIKAWMRRDNAGLTMRLVCKGGQIAGVTSDVTASVTTTNAWEELTITFTPTETGVVEITAEAWGGITFSGWVDDLTISQA